MGIEELSELDILHGCFSTLLVVVSLIVGLRLLLKYFNNRRKEYITIGFSWMFIASPWFGNSISFLLYISINTRLELVPYLFLENFFIPIALVCWIYSFCKLEHPILVKKGTFIFLLICVLYEIYLITALIINPQSIGTLEGMFDSSHTVIPNVFRIFGILIVLITGLLLSSTLRKSEDMTVKWKGRFLLMGIISFTIGAFLDAVLIFTPLELVIVRLLLISSSIEFYLGFFLPQSIA
ncbi:MAG: hypothetical protein ACFFCM_19985, partial [Promethearchaeota archaeon]